MGWYKTGTVSVASGSNAVIGTGTSFIANSRVGDAFRGPDGEWYEVTNIASDTALSIAPNYQGPTQATGVYSLAPMQGYVKDSADALRAATQVIASGVADMQEQVAVATEAAASAGQSKTAATEQAGIASSAAQTSTENKDAAQQAAQQSGTSAQASGTAADRAEAAKTSIIQSEQAAAASATAAAESAAHAEEVTLGKAASGDNNDITSLNGLTTPLSVQQGGTGRQDGTIVYVSDFGIGGTLGIRLPGDNANETLANGSYFTSTSWVGSPFSGSDNRNQGYLEHANQGVNTYAFQMLRGLTSSSGELVRYKTEGAWGAWGPSSGAAWGSITGTLSAQADLKVALDAKASTAGVPLMPTGATFIRLADASNTAVTLPAGGTWTWWFIRMNSSSGVYSGVNPQVGVSAGGTVISAATAGIYPMGIAWKIS